MIYACDRTRPQHYEATATGRRYWSVSEVRAVMDPDAFAYVTPEVLEAAGERGRRLHTYFAVLLYHKLGKSGPPDEVRGDEGYCAAIRRAVEELKLEPLLIEHTSANDQLGYAGTFDFLGRLYGKPRRWLLDLKGGVETKTDAVQTMAYRKTTDGAQARTCGDLYVQADGMYRLIERPFESREWAGFLAGVALLNWRVR